MTNLEQLQSWADRAKADCLVDVKISAAPGYATASLEEAAGGLLKLLETPGREVTSEPL